jgi:hypothetical protein
VDTDLAVETRLERLTRLRRQAALQSGGGECFC